MELLPESKLTVVKHIINKWPAYANYIRGFGIDPLRISTIAELPPVSREFIGSAVFSIFPTQIKSIVPSSGSTGKGFSFGVYGNKEIKSSEKSIDSFLEKRFDTRTKKTILLNTLPGSILLQSSSVSVASIGSRVDTALSAIETLGSYYSQLILVGEPLFIKMLIEHGIEFSLAWKYLPLFIIVGGEWFSESYRAYIENIIGRDRLFSSMGMAELGLNYFIETEETINLRRLLSQDEDARQLLLGKETNFSPMLFTYDQNEIYVETLRESDAPLESILLTTLNRNRIMPLIRYKSGDKGKLLERGEINSVLKKLGRRFLVAPHGRPILAHFGRGHNVRGIYPERVKEIMYSSADLAHATTGNFTICETLTSMSLEIQLKKGLFPTPVLNQSYREAFSEYASNIRLYTFESFPHELDFQRKARYVCEDNSGEDARRKDIELSAQV